VLLETLLERLLGLLLYRTDEKSAGKAAEIAAGKTYKKS